MATYAELAREPAYRAEFVPPNMNRYLLDPLRAYYQMGPALIGAKGDNRHLKGRHRSRNWCLTSAFCTNRSYGTRDARDKEGNGDWLRGNDIGITDATLYAACRRLDAAVRAGRLPGVAEWFGTFDGRTVVGWFEGRPSSSDSSHLWHLHVGWWTGSANDAAQMALAYQIITGTEQGEEDPDVIMFLEVEVDGPHPIYEITGTDVATGKGRLVHVSSYEYVVFMEEQFGAKRVKVAGLPSPEHWVIVTAEAPTVAAQVDLTPAAVAQVADAVVDEQRDRLAE